MFGVLLACNLWSCARARVGIVGADEQATVGADVAAFVHYALEPAGIAPPTVSWEDREVVADGLVARLVPIRAEDAAWNRWPDGTARLFNNRVAHLFYVRVEGEGPLGWRPRGSTLELNDPDNRLVAAASAEDLLGELTFWAVMQERWLLDGDLAARTRASGPFRSSYLPLRVDGDVLEGIVAFPVQVVGDPGRSQVLADLHVVALRLTLQIDTPGGVVPLVWTFD